MENLTVRMHFDLIFDINILTMITVFINNITFHYIFPHDSECI